MDIADLIEHGLPAFAVEALEDRGITSLDELQEQAVRAGLFRGNNLVISGPTSSGKTLVGELAALHHAVTRSGSVFLTPLKALAYEKYLVFRDSYSRPESFMFETGIATGDEVTDEAAIAPNSLTVATYEKWYFSLIEHPHLISQKSLVVVDELQIIGDPKRGATVESLLAWIKTKAPEVQLIGLSATTPNAAEMADWLGADVVTTDRRSVPLTEQLWSTSGVFEVKREEARQGYVVESTAQETDTLSAVQKLEDADQLPAVVFCLTKQDTERFGAQSADQRNRRAECETLVNHLDEVAEANPTNRVLRQVLPKGIGFHNANLSHDERRLIEKAFRDGQLDLLFATTTLSAGVNLPARSVVISECHRSWVPEYISRAEYLNMAGRAGRRGLQEQGLSVLLARTGAEADRYKTYLEGSPERVTSQLTEEAPDRVVLQAIAGGIVTHREGVETFLRNSFHAHTTGTTLTDEDVGSCLDRLGDLEMVMRYCQMLWTGRVRRRVVRSVLHP